MTGTPVWFDTHAHLSDAQFDLDRKEVVERALKAGVTTLVEIGDGPEEWSQAQSLADSYPKSVYWAAGLHPYYADQASTRVWDGLKRCAGHPRFVALGEVGLDYAKCTIQKDKQISTFKQALQISQEINKPLIIHCREAFYDLIPILQEFFGQGKKSTDSPGVIHCFSGGRNEAQTLVQLGFFLGVDGPITYPKSQALRDTLACVNLDRLVLETDSPYLPPQTHRGKRNEPFHIPAIGQVLAQIKGAAPAQVADQTRKNSFALFQLKPSI